jgi:hypothetical protein
VKAAGRRFYLAPSECGRVAVGGMRHGRMGGGGLGVLRKEEGPEWAGVGPKGQGGLGWHGKFPRKIVRASNRVWAELVIGL